MATGAQAEAVKADVEWEVGPTEDVIRALIETLVDPRLPLTASASDPPSMDVQKSVARQMYAVVLLYNYYHRKQKPELEYLDLFSFCKLAMSLRPSLATFMNITSQLEPMALDVAENQLSLTEESMKEACATSLSLDASIGVPLIEGWAITKVGVLLIDSKKENCLLWFGSVTEGVWSLIEKEIDELHMDHESLTEEKVGAKRKFFAWKMSLRQTAFNVVKETTEIDRADLVLMETHVTYSLSKEKSATQFFMMQYSKQFSTNQSVPLKFLVESLRGPLAKKYDDGWASTDFVEYFHMVPYVEFISSWLSRKDSCLPSLNGYNAPSCTRSGEKESTNQAVLPSQKTTMFENSEMAVTVYPEIFDSDDYEYLKGSLSTTSKEPGTMSELIQSCPKAMSDDTRKKLNSKTIVYNPSQANIPSGQNGREGTSFIKVETQPSCILCEDDKKTREKGMAIPDIPSSESGLIEMKSKKDSVDRQNALALLYRKRQEIFSQICAMEDELALYEDCIERIRDGGDVGMARECINSIISRNGIESNSDNIFLPGPGRSSSSCQFLEIICGKNKWRLPRYLVESCDGKFVSKVVIVIRGGEEMWAEGGVECSPIDARQSAALGMIAKLQDHLGDCGRSSATLL